MRNWKLNMEIPPGASVLLKTFSKRSDGSKYPLIAASPGNNAFFCINTKIKYFPTLKMFL